MNKELIKLCVDASMNKVVTYSKDEATEVIRKAFVDIIGTDKPDYRTFQKHSDEIFEIVETVLDQYITSGFTGNEFFESYVDYITTEFGDTAKFYVEDNSLLSVSKLSGNHWDIARQKLNGNASFTVSTDWYGIKIYQDFMMFLAKRADFSTFVAKVQKSIDNFMNELLYTSFMGASQYLPTAFKATGTFDADKMTTLIEHVQASNAGSEIVIVGTKSALSKMNGTVDIAWSEEMKTQKNKLGVVSYWNGYRLMVINQVHARNTFDFAIDDKKLLVLPVSAINKPIKVVKEGTPIVKEITDGTTNMDMSMEYAIQFRLGIAVIFNQMFGSYALA